MADIYSPPSVDPSTRGELTGTVRLILNKFLNGVDDMIPAKVIAYDRTTNRARIQPLIAMVTTDGIQVNRAQIASVPVFQLGGGGFVISFPLSTGDLGWIKANDADISIFKQTLQNSPPNTIRQHSFEDAMFFPDTMFKSVSIASEDADSVVLQTLNGAHKITISPSGIKMTSSATVTIDAPNVTMTNDLTVNGEIIGNGITYSTHTHSGVQTGSGNTGAPNP